ncbi:hypothetical protein T439DRAFT_15844 [Meredithblackwellia eburnea MCA 4105]
MAHRSAFPCPRQQICRHVSSAWLNAEALTPTANQTNFLLLSLASRYFSRSHACTGMLNHIKFIESLQLAPTHPSFPHPSLIHALMAHVALHVPPDIFSGEERYWGKHSHLESAADYHASRAKLGIDEAVATGVKILQQAQATILLCFYSYSSGRFLEAWMYTALATRICSPLGLNRIRPLPAMLETDDGPRTRIKSGLLRETDDSDELYERTVTFWMAYCADRFACASTGWATSLDDDDISSLLPSPGPALPSTSEEILASPLFPKNPSFFVSHPPHLVQVLQLYIKANILLGRVCNYRHRAPAPLGTKIVLESSNQEIRNSPSFKRIDSDIEAFQLSIPREYKDILEIANSDSRLCLISALPYTSLILLHEQLCTSEEGDVSMAKCLKAARGILKAIYTLWSSSFDIGLLAPFINFSWSCAGRTLIRHMAMKEAKGDFSESTQVRADVGLLIAAMTAFKTPLGDSTAAVLQALLEHPEDALPEGTTGTHQSFNPDRGSLYQAGSHMLPKWGTTTTMTANSAESTSGTATLTALTPSGSSSGGGNASGESPNLWP